MPEAEDAHTWIYWMVMSLASAPGHMDWLHPEECRIFSHFRFPKKRRDWLLGRWTAKQATRIFMAQDLPLSEIAILPSDSGAPEVYVAGNPAPVAISFSHSHGMCFCGVSGPGISFGCDMEKLEQRSEALVRDHFTQEEQACFDTARGIHKDLVANLIWSSKEAVLKALKTGLRIDTRRVEVTPGKELQADRWHAFTGRLLEPKETFAGQWMWSGDFVHTVACRKKDFALERISCNQRA